MEHVFCGGWPRSLSPPLGFHASHWDLKLPKCVSTLSTPKFTLRIREKPSNQVPYQVLEFIGTQLYKPHRVLQPAEVHIVVSRLLAYVGTCLHQLRASLGAPTPSTLNRPLQSTRAVTQRTHCSWTVCVAVACGSAACARDGRGRDREALPRPSPSSQP